MMSNGQLLVEMNFRLFVCNAHLHERMYEQAWSLSTRELHPIFRVPSERGGRRDGSEDSTVHQEV